MNANELMSKDFVTVKPNTKVTAATKLMSEKNSSCLVIIEDERPVGIVTENDLVVRVLSADKDPHATPVSSIMSSPLMHIGPETSVLDAIATMHQKNFSQLPVIENGKLVGLVRLTDLMRYLVGFFSAHRW